VTSRKENADSLKGVREESVWQWPITFHHHGQKLEALLSPHGL